LFVWANDIAKLAAIVLFPSPGPGLLTRMDFSGAPGDVNSRLVLRVPKCSDTGDLGIVIHDKI